jgi:hypothetical protein
MLTWRDSVGVYTVKFDYWTQVDITPHAWACRPVQPWSLDGREERRLVGHSSSPKAFAMEHPHCLQRDHTLWGTALSGSVKLVLLNSGLEPFLTSLTSKDNYIGASHLS